MREQHDGPTRVAGTWLGSAWHERWLEAETDRLLEFGRGSRLAGGGFARQGDDGAPQDGALELWVTCRMTHVHALGHLMGRPGCGALADHGVAAITTLFADAEHGGWFSQVGRDGAPLTTAKEAYPHAFVVLASSSATAAGRPGAAELLASALDVSERHFWDEEQGMAVEEWDRTFTTRDGYRGVNANMHTVEAYLAAADVTGQRVWLDRAVRILERVVHGWAREWSWRLPEHFDATWTAVPDYNRDRPADPFRPFGATIGHWFEWARLTLHARAALEVLGDEPAAWMLEDPQGLFDAAVREGWAVDGSAGFVYTVDFEGRPVVRERMHWVAAEAIGRPPRCTTRRATRHTACRTARGWTTSTPRSSTGWAARGGTSSAPRARSRGRRGAPRPTSTTRCRRPSSRGCRSPRRWRPRCGTCLAADPGPPAPRRRQWAADRLGRSAAHSPWSG